MTIWLAPPIVVTKIVIVPICRADRPAGTSKPAVTQLQAKIMYNTSKQASIMYVTTLPVADARAQFSRLIDATTTTHERFEITRNGRRAAVLMSADDYDILQDTIAVLSDAELLNAHRDGRAALEAGDYLDADQLAHAMRKTGRLPE